MEDYLQGYLQVLPDYQRKRIEDILKEHSNLYNISSVSEEQFGELISRLTDEHKPLTQALLQEDKLDPDRFNQFFTNMHVDLNLLFLETLLSESATTNYERIFDGIIGDLNREVRALSERVESLRLVSEGEDGLLVRKQNFENATDMEDRSAFASLFVDRDGTPAPSAVFEQKHDQYFVALGKTKETDALRNEQGLPSATIRVVERRGVPIVTSETERYQLENATDSSPETYWAEVVLADEPITTAMKKG